VFSNGGGTREIGDTILVLPDAAAAATALEGAKAALGSSVVGSTPAPASIGSDSVIVSGTSPDGAKAVTVLLFTQGPALTTLEFDSAAGDPVPAEFAPMSRASRPRRSRPVWAAAPPSDVSGFWQNWWSTSGFPADVRDELDREHILVMAEKASVVRHFSGRIPGRRETATFGSAEDLWAQQPGGVG